MAVGYELMARPCDQCLTTRQRIVSGTRAAQIMRDTRRMDCAFVCHKSPNGRKIACRGHHDATGGGQMARIADRLRMVIEIDPATLLPTIEARNASRRDDGE